MANHLGIIGRSGSIIQKLWIFRTVRLRPFSCSANMLGSDAEFQAAQNQVQKLSSRPDNQVMLQLYSLFKQSTVGTCKAPKPGMMDFVGKAKWTAWNDLGSMSLDNAKDKYIELVNNLVVADGGGEQTVVETTTNKEDGAYKYLKIAKEGGLYNITLNRPEKKNALNRETYRELQNALKEAGEDKKVALATLTGAGDFYCSGNDLSNFTSIDPSNLAKGAKEGRDLLLDFIKAFINFPKPLIGLVNGPAIGVAATTLGLCDVVYASDSATFQTPMVELGQTPEGCSSVQFAKIMGQTRANEMLLFGRQISASQACEWGLVTEVFPQKSFHSEVTSRVAKLAQLPPESLQHAKYLMRKADMAELHEANVVECDRLEERWQSKECFTAIMNFFEKKSKL